MDKIGKVFLAIPTYDGTLHGSTLRSVLTATNKFEISQMTMTSSFLTHGFNLLWCNAIAQDADYFAMIHADLGAEPGWADTLIDELEQHQADVVSAIVPIKSRERKFSTALGRMHEEAHYRLQADDLAKLPATFGTEDLQRVTGEDGLLLLNTGCWVARLKQPWNRAVAFRTHTDIKWDGDEAYCVQIPEDWDFSYQCHALGLKLLATRKVKCTHWGVWSWSSGKFQEYADCANMPIVQQTEG